MLYEVITAVLDAAGYIKQIGTGLSDRLGLMISQRLQLILNRFAVGERDIVHDLVQSKYHLQKGQAKSRGILQPSEPLLQLLNQSL